MSVSDAWNESWKSSWNLEAIKTTQCLGISQGSHVQYNCIGIVFGFCFFFFSTDSTPPFSLSFPLISHPPSLHTHPSPVHTHTSHLTLNCIHFLTFSFFFLICSLEINTNLFLLTSTLSSFTPMSFPLWFQMPLPLAEFVLNI